MRTLTLLAAILLLAPQAQAQPLPENAEEALEQQQPQQEDQDQDVAISSAGAENSGAQYEGESYFPTYQDPALRPQGLPAMRTLALLAAILLLALQAQAQPLPENAEEALEQQQPQQEDQDVTISFSVAGSSGLQGGASVKVCRCKTGSCGFPKAKSGSCYKHGKMAKFCCR
ncbi:Defensin-5 [Fukomys damarensis]|uniref:Defensin-5 n=1 Tax=Fukomys damarensis TaxID=885580 RepID=A0A091EQM6_FUKDA|nr:Defensin-5 [Fukomys damarensis]